jgi:hypothetical protein
MSFHGGKPVAEASKTVGDSESSAAVEKEKSDGSSEVDFPGS